MFMANFVYHCILIPKKIDLIIDSGFGRQKLKLSWLQTLTFKFKTQKMSNLKMESLTNTDFDNFQSEVTKFKGLISSNPSNLQKFESLLYKFLVDELKKTDHLLAKKS
jgi:uncharacterized protein YggL (DUF469 family)